MKKHPRIFLSTPMTEHFQGFRKEFANLINAFGFDIILAEKKFDVGTPIVDKIENLLKNSDLIVADVTEENATISFELGYASALHIPIILIIDKDNIPSKFPRISVEKFPILTYQRNNLKSLVKSLQKFISIYLKEKSQK